LPTSPGYGNLPLERDNWVSGLRKLIFKENKMKTWFCKGTFCKGTLAAAVACPTLLTASPVRAAACSNASLKGQYGQTISGQILPGNNVVLPQNGVAMTNFDGNGKFTQVDFVVIDGTN
jgi:hypothetical protein